MLGWVFVEGKLFGGFWMILGEMGFGGFVKGFLWGCCFFLAYKALGKGLKKCWDGFLFGENFLTHFLLPSFVQNESVLGGTCLKGLFGSFS